MADNPEEKKSCGGHGCRCGAKIVGALVLVLLGWICGFLAGSGGLCRRSKDYCPMPMSMLSCPMTGPAAKPTK